MKDEEDYLEPSQIDPARFNLRNKGLKSAGGKLHKGCVKDAFTKLSIGSIPSNYQSIIYRCEEKKGFGTSQKRFYNIDNMSEIIRSEYEQDEETQSPIKKINASHSSKGYGPLIAKEKREWYTHAHSPGPGKYFDQKQKLENHPIQKTIQKKKRHCYSREREDFKRKELALNKENQDLPGPGYYEVKDKDQNTLAGCKSSFATKDAREGYLNKNNTPGPGHYNGSDTQKVQKNREILEQQLFAKLSKEKQHMGKHFLPKPKQQGQPGPGYYDHDIPNFKPLYERIKISHNFVQTGKDRFQDPSEKEKSPTPCTYEISSSFDKIQKKLIDLSSFMSDSRRMAFGGRSPCSKVFYDGPKDQSKNFHFNITGKWV